ncbi:4-dihydrotrisporin dehydrogenase [Zychaea mexicana]|uniref:4-dihydrotrisporin dehydrogenase n=1 Tax=Zychaea mexicana TaxID=64656 RepID=UPI0022FE6722|nr:4-dihydrotrisporin dehydrogenase [Zychaea mexicana]KAI9491377.1 4-dihydrotrisporin dehydrogenase [Zychaea mexicana]
MTLTFVVTGTSRGIGVEFIKQLSAKGHTVFACARNPHQSDKLQVLINDINVHPVAMDITNQESVKAAVEQIQTLAPEGIDVLINNAAIPGVSGANVTNTTAEDYMNVFETNVVGTSTVTMSLLPWLRKRNTRHIVNIVSIMASMQNTTRGIGAAYRVSKAAENMLTRTLAGELGEEGFVVLALHPGWVKTDMGTDQALYTPEESVSGMLSVIGDMSLETNGKFISFQGKELPW